MKRLDFLKSVLALPLAAKYVQVEDKFKPDNLMPPKGYAITKKIKGVPMDRLLRKVDGGIVSEMSLKEAIYQAKKTDKDIIW